MLPSRSGRSGFPAAFIAFLSLVSLSCIAFAKEKGAKSESPSPSVAKSPSKAAEGLTNVPLAVGHDAKGLVLPIFGPGGQMRAKLEAGIARRLDTDHIQFKSVKFTTFTEENTPELEVVMEDSIFDLKTQLVKSLQRSTVKRVDLDITADAMQFDMVARKTTLTGNVKMVVTGKARTPGEATE